MAGPRLGVLGLAILLVVASARSAAAADQASERERRACTPDVFRLCSEFIPDAARITHCLQKKVRLLNPECRSVFASPGRR
jgi:hypothetical protein